MIKHRRFRNYLKNPVSRSVETTCHLVENDDESHGHLCLCYPTFDANHQVSDTGMSFDEFIRISAHTLLRTSLGHLG